MLHVLLVFAFLGLNPFRKPFRKAKHKRSRLKRCACMRSVPIADMGKFQEVLMRRAAQGASPLRDPYLDTDDLHRSVVLRLVSCAPGPSEHSDS